MEEEAVSPCSLGQFGERSQRGRGAGREYEKAVVYPGVDVRDGDAHVLGKEQEEQVHEAFPQEGARCEAKWHVG